MNRLYYEEDGIAIWHGDSRGALPLKGGEPMADVVLTDPPFDVKTHAGARSANDLDNPMPFVFDPIDPRDVAPFLVYAARRWAIAFCALEQLGDYKSAAGEYWVRAGVYHRTDSEPQFTGDRPAQPGEGLAIMHRTGKKRWSGGGHQAFYEHTVVRGADRVHPTQKPEGLMMALVHDFSDVGETILDPYMGSGTTLCAAKRLGRRAIGIEINEEFCAIAVKRLRQGVLAFSQEA